MMMATRLSVIRGHPVNNIHTSSRCLRSRFLVLACLHKTAFASTCRLFPQLCFSHVSAPSSVNSPK
nr:TPA_asm: hypothetical protein HUJ06_017808 [Nelumbo nucifera]